MAEKIINYKYYYLLLATYKIITTELCLYAAAKLNGMIRHQPLRLIIYCSDQNECVYDILLSTCHHFITLDLKYLSVTFVLGTPS